MKDLFPSDENPNLNFERVSYCGHRSAIVNK